MKSLMLLKGYITVKSCCGIFYCCYELQTFKLNNFTSLIGLTYSWKQNRHCSKNISTSSLSVKKESLVMMHLSKPHFFLLTNARESKNQYRGQDSKVFLQAYVKLRGKKIPEKTLATRVVSLKVIYTSGDKSTVPLKCMPCS